MTVLDLLWMLRRGRVQSFLNKSKSYVLSLFVSNIENCIVSWNSMLRAHYVGRIILAVLIIRIGHSLDLISTLVH